MMPDSKRADVSIAWAGRQSRKTNPQHEFLNKLKAHSEFEMIPGKMFPHTEFWKFRDKKTKSGAILHFPEDSDFRDRICLKILWVPPEQSRKGIATRCLKSLLKIVTGVDKRCKLKDGTMSAKCFSIWLVPNPFHAPDWNFDQRKCKVDFGYTEYAGENIRDETYKKLPKSQLRLPWTKLRDFYIGLGFVECPKLSWITGWDDNWNGFRTIRSMGDRAYEIGRKALVFPAENAATLDSMLSSCTNNA